MELNLVDGLLAVIVLFGAFSGWRRGFVLAALELAVLVASVVAALLAYPLLAPLLLSLWTTGGVWISPVSFLLAFALAYVLFGAIAGRMVRAVPRRAHAHGVNRFFGLVPGAASGLINATIVALLLLSVPLIDGLNRMARDGAIASRLAEPAEWLEATLSPIFDPAVKRMMRTVTVAPESKQTIPLKFQVSDAKPRPDLEARMLEMVNAEREKAGLRPVKPDPRLTEVARAHSGDMFALGYFSHYTPEGRDLGDRLKAADLRYLAAGENLALAQTLPVAHNGLMKSPGHRANILRPQFGRLGVGVLDGGAYGLMVTQNFRN
jgi:uncharacterized protein YkwD